MPGRPRWPSHRASSAVNPTRGHRPPARARRPSLPVPPPPSRPMGSEPPPPAMTSSPPSARMTRLKSAKSRSTVGINSDATGSWKMNFGHPGPNGRPSSKSGRSAREAIRITGKRRPVADARICDPSHSDAEQRGKATPRTRPATTAVSSSVTPIGGLIERLSLTTLLAKNSPKSRHSDDPLLSNEVLRVALPDNTSGL